MKKRILSMLLLVVMLVAALPLSVLPTLAAEKKAPDAPVYTEGDYNALYVQDGLLMGADFFKLNKYWNPEGAGHILYVVPLAPAQDKACVVDGVEYDFTSADVRNANSEAYIAAVTAWKTEYKDFVNSFNWTSGNVKFALYQDYSNGADIAKYAERFTTVVDAADGYMQFRSDYYASGGMIVSGVSAASTETTAQYVASYTDAGIGKTEVTFLFHNIRPRLTATAADGVKLYGFSTTHFGGSIHSDETDSVAPLGQPFTMTQSLALSSTAGEDAFSLRVGTDTLVDLTGDYGTAADAKLDVNNHYIGWGAAQSWLRLYAYRHYDRVIEDSEIAQNHLADLLKYFRLDLGYINLLDEAHLANVAEAAKALTFDDSYEKVSGVILTAAKAEAEAQFTGIDVDLFTVIAKYGLDATPFGIYPLYYLKHARDFLVSGYLACENADAVVTAYEAALDADYRAMWIDSKTTEDDYKALYVNNGLILGFDVMALNAYWGEAVNARAEYPESPMYNNAYKHTDDKTYDFTKLYKDENGVEYPYYVDRYTALNANGVEEYHIIRANNNGDGINGYTGFTDLSGSYPTLAAAKAEVDRLEAADISDNSDTYKHWITGYTQSAAYKAAGKDYYSKVNAWLKAYHWSIEDSKAVISSGTNASTTSNISNTRRDSLMVYGASLDPVAGQGYLVRSFPFCTDQGFQIGNITGNLNEASAQLVSRPGSGMSSNFLLHYNVRPTVASGKITGTTQSFTVDKTKPVISNAFDRSAVQSMTFTLKGATTANGTATDCDSYAITTPAGTLFSATGVYHNTTYNNSPTDVRYDTTTNDTHILGYSNSFGNAEIYAIRYYNRAITAEEEKQNHVADIIKWYKLDIRGIDIAKMASDLYTLFADVTFESHTRREVQDMLSSLTVKAATADYEAKYDAYYKTDIPAEYIELGRLYGLDLDILTEGLPRAYLSGTYALLGELVAKQYTEPDGANAAARLAAAYALDRSHYTLSDMTAEQYNDLFVKDGMVAGIDFYFTNKYWTNTPVATVKNTGTADAVIADAKKLLDGYRYADSKVTFSNVKMPKGATLTIKDGYLDLAGIMGEFSFNGIESAMNYGVNGSSVELVRATKRAAYLPVLNSLRISVTAEGEVSAINNGSFTMYSGITAITASNKLGTALIYKDFQSVHTYTMNMQRDAILFNAENDTDTFRKQNPGKITDYYTSTTATSPANYYTGDNVYPYTTDADGKITVDTRTPVYTPEEHGKNVNLTTTKGGALSSICVISTRDYPAKPVIPAFTLDADGNPVANTEGKAYWIAPDNRFVDGAFSIYQDGEMLYDNDSAQFVNNGYYKGSDSFIVLWSSDAGQVDNSGKFYAARYYGRYLSVAEQAQNHFIDLAKFYRLDLSEYMTLDAAARGAVHTAFADFAVAESDRAVLEYTYQKAVQAQLDTVYEGLEAENADIVAKNPAFFDLAATYRLDLAGLLTSDRSMDHAIERVSADALLGMDFAGADAYFADLYYDAYYHVPYLREGADQWNAWIGKLIDGNVRAETERLMLLPQTVREGILKAENNLNADAIAAYAEGKLALYGDPYGGMTPEDYDALYAGLDASLISMDFFKTNEYWNMSGELPTPPSETTNYLYDGKTYDFTKAENRLVQANEKNAIVCLDANEKIIGYAYRNKAGAWAAGHANYPNDTKAYGNYSKVMPRQTFTDTEIDEMLASAKAGLPNYTLKKVEVPLWIIWREPVAGGVGYFYTNDNTFVNGSTGAVKVYMSEADAKVDVVTLAGAGATEKDGVYTSADGKYRYYARVRPIATAEYYDCISTYGSKVVTDYLYGADIGDERTVAFYQNMPTIGELTSYQSQTGLDHIYSNLSFKNGYMELDCTHSGPYISVSYIPTKSGSTVYFDALLAGGDKNAADTKALTFQGANLLFTINEAGAGLSKVGSTAVSDMSVSGRNTPFRLEIDSTATADNAATFKVTLNNNADTAKTVNVTTGTQSLIGHSHASALRIYTYRIYNRALTEAEQLQNHFMDLAKYYRLDLTEYKAATLEERAAIHALFADYEIGSVSRGELVVLYNSAEYEAAAKVLSPDMMAVARELGLNVSGLLAAEPAVRAYAESAVFADFRVGMPMERKVVQAVVDQSILYKNAFAFEGVQVRLQSASGDLPGVRAIFSANKNVINAYAASGKDVAFGVEICDASGKALAELRFTAKDGVYAGTNTVLASGKTSDAVIREVGENSLAFAYTVTFGEGAQSAAYYETEFGYRFFVEVDGLRNIVEAVRSDAFDATVCAAEAYRYFYENGYADDRVVSAVIAALGE